MAAALLWPAVHARLKSVQHGQARYGRHRFSYTPAVLPFYGLYLRLVGWGILAVALTFMVGMVLASDAARAGKAPPVWFFLASAGASLAAWLVAWPFFATRLQQVIWPRTQLGPVRFSASLRGWPMLKLVLGQTLLVLLTAGLYWPWAAVAMAKRRVESIAVHAPEPLHAMQFEATSSQGRGGATGDSAAEVFGLDLGW